MRRTNYHEEIEIRADGVNAAILLYSIDSYGFLVDLSVFENSTSNLEKHGVSFEEAASTFDEKGLDWEDSTPAETEDRRKRLVMSERRRILLTVYTLRRLTSGKEGIRIISARCASRREREAYLG